MHQIAQICTYIFKNVLQVISSSPQNWPLTLHTHYRVETKTKLWEIYPVRLHEEDKTVGRQWERLTRVIRLITNKVKDFSHFYKSGTGSTWFCWRKVHKKTKTNMLDNIHSSGLQEHENNGVQHTWMVFRHL